MLGLTWRNVDLDTRRLAVSQQILSVEYEAKVADVKTTHSRRTMEIADRLYGVTMEEPGVSKLISLQMN